ncbi:MAG: hypothetical protein M1838_000949 [Thelocarpon superellum]|nr:MAG: hypothetical protein M1838_000949 [Thelocarpon superellum]
MSSGPSGGHAPPDFEGREEKVRPALTLEDADHDQDDHDSRYASGSFVIGESSSDAGHEEYGQDDDLDPVHAPEAVPVDQAMSGNADIILKPPTSSLPERPNGMEGPHAEKIEAPPSDQRRIARPLSKKATATHLWITAAREPPARGAQRKIHFKGDRALRDALEEFLRGVGGHGLTGVYDGVRRFIAAYATPSHARAAAFALQATDLLVRNQKVWKTIDLMGIPPAVMHQVTPRKRKRMEPSDISTPDLPGEVTRPDLSAQASLMPGVGVKQPAECGTSTKVAKRQQLHRDDKRREKAQAKAVAPFIGDQVESHVSMEPRVVQLQQLIVLLHSARRDFLFTARGQRQLARLLPRREDEAKLEKAAAARYAAESGPWQSDDREDTIFLRQIRQQKLSDPYRRAAIHETEAAFTYDRVDQATYDRLMSALLTPDERYEKSIGNRAHVHCCTPHAYRVDIIDLCGEWYSLDVAADESEDDYQEISGRDYNLIFAEYAYCHHTEPEKAKRGYPLTEEEARARFYLELNLSPAFDMGFLEGHTGLGRLSIHGDRAEENDAMLESSSKSDARPPLPNLETINLAEGNDTDVSSNSYEPPVVAMGETGPGTVGGLSGAVRELQMRYVGLGQPYDASFADQFVLCMICGGEHLEADCPPSLCVDCGAPVAEGNTHYGGNCSDATKDKSVEQELEDTFVKSNADRFLNPNSLLLAPSLLNTRPMISTPAPRTHGPRGKRKVDGNKSDSEDDGGFLRPRVTTGRRAPPQMHIVGHNNEDDSYRPDRQARRADYRQPPLPNGRPPTVPSSGRKQGGDSGDRGFGFAVRGRGTVGPRGGHGNVYHPMPSAASNAWKRHRM